MVLGDLGLAKDASLILSNASLTTKMCTIQYMPPEIVNESTDYTEKIDIWYNFFKGCFRSTFYSIDLINRIILTKNNIFES